jgi:hypothetical protein
MMADYAKRSQGIEVEKLSFAPLNRSLDILCKHASLTKRELSRRRARLTGLSVDYGSAVTEGP